MVLTAVETTLTFMDRGFSSECKVTLPPKSSEQFFQHSSKQNINTEKNEVPREKKKKEKGRKKDEQ